MKMTFQPKKRQRAKVHGFRQRMKTAGGRKVIAATRIFRMYIITVYRLLTDTSLCMF